MQSALNDFKGDLARITGVADWLDTPDALDPKLSASTTAIRCGSVVLLSGYLETFLHDCLRAFIRDVNNLSKPIEKLPEKMHFVHFEKGARFLIGVAAAERREAVVPVKSIDLATRLSSTKLNVGYELAWEAFTRTQANPGPDVVKEMLKDVAIEDPWERLRLAASANAGDLQLSLTSLIAMRNECAHSGSTQSPPTASDLRQHCQNLEVLGLAIVTVLEAQRALFSAL